MKKKLLFSAFLLLIFHTSSLLALDLFWDPDGEGANCGGAGTWNTTSLLWGPAPCEGPYRAWANSTTNTATFLGTGGATIDLGVNITVNKLTNYSTIAGTTSYAAGNQITFGGTSPTIHTTNKLAFTLPLKGAITLTKTGSGQLQLNNNAQTMTQFMIKGGAITTANTNKWGTARTVDGVYMDGGRLGDR